MQVLIGLFLLASPLLQLSLAERENSELGAVLLDVDAHGTDEELDATPGLMYDESYLDPSSFLKTLDNASLVMLEEFQDIRTMKDPGASCSSTSWCSSITSSSPFCAKRRGSASMCYIKQGKDAGSTPHFCTVPNYVVDGKCALKKFDETCEEDSDCEGYLKCSASEKKCKHSCKGLGSDYCPKCHNGKNRAPTSGSTTVGQQLDARVCPTCCSNNGNADLCCFSWRTLGAMRNRRFNGCAKTRDAMCIDNVCEDVGITSPDFRCQGSGNNVGQL